MLIGATLGSYRVLSKVGEGGMGEVYRAHDTKLNRDVAIKVLPVLFAEDAERLARFNREAQTLAALNHPNIAQIYGLESLSPGDGNHGQALVMELVDGDDLSAIIARGRILSAEALPIARQIAEALEAAHEQGIVHRDLKPANVKVRPDGTVKVLDFGLAKALDPSASSSVNAMHSPTLTARATQMGMIIGTAAYMAPEQAKGKAVDKRADIWAFGVVLYEMLTGRRAFEGDDISTTLAAVLMKDPDWTALPAETPAAVVSLVRRCLEREPRARLRDIGEARLLLTGGDLTTTPAAPAISSPPSAGVRSSRLPWLITAAATIAAAVFAGLWATKSVPAADASIHVSLAPPPGHSISGAFAISPDGRKLAIEVADNTNSAVALWVRDLGSGSQVKLRGTDGGTLPFWSPSGTEIAFFAEGKLKRTDLDGSPPQVICAAPSPRGGTWGPDGNIVFAASFRTGLETVSAAGGTPRSLTTLDETRHEKSHRWPAFLPGGTRVLFLAQTGEATSKDDNSSIEVLTVATGQRTRILAANSSPLYSPDGFLLFWREGSLRAQPFDAERQVVSGSIATIATGVAFDGNELTHASVSTTGTLVYSTATAVSRTDIAIVDRAGRTLQTIAESVLVEGGIALSHDGKRLAASVTADGGRDTDLWIYDLEPRTAAPLTFEEGGERLPIWSFDDRHVLYVNDRKNDGIVFRRFADGRGQPEVIASNPQGYFLSAISRDSASIIVTTGSAGNSFDIWRHDLASKKLTPLVQTPSSDVAGALSPDERWLAYQSEETGRFEVSVRSLMGDDRRWRISTLGGTTPLWRQDGRELYYQTPQGHIMAASVEPGDDFHAGAPRELFRAHFSVAGSVNRDYRPYAPFPDGQRFVVDVMKERSATLLTLVTNWNSR